MGPDFPAGADFTTPRDELRKMYRTGAESVRMRAWFERVERIAIEEQQ